MVKPRLLAVVPYGMAFRNLVLNSALWDHLLSQFSVDLLSPLSIVDSHRIGMARVYGPQTSTGVARLARALKRSAAAAVSELDKLAFFMRSNEAETFRSIYRYSSIDGKVSRLLLWSWLGHSSLGPALKRLARSVAGAALGAPALRSYQLVLLTHNSEPTSVAVGLEANRLGVSVVCMPMGLDNLMHAPLAFVPDLLLVWGEEQRRDFEIQGRFNPALRRTTCAIVGSTAHDAYLASHGSVDVESAYSLEPDDDVILFAAYVEKYGDFQLPLCRLLLRFIRESGRKIKLLVRTRPGFDEDRWRQFQAANQREVRLQSPAGASYDKSGRATLFDLDRERSEVELFAATMRRCRVLVTPTFSTMEVDAMLFGKPAINAIFDPERPDDVHPLLAWFWAGLSRISEWRDMKVATSADELMVMLDDIFGRGRDTAYVSERLFRYRATAPDGRAGARAVDALRRFTEEFVPRGSVRRSA